MVEKIKEMNLKIEDWLCVMKKLEEESISAPLGKNVGGHVSPLPELYHF